MRRSDLFGIILLGAVAGCSSDTAANTVPVHGSSRVLLTDDPFPYSRVARADIYVVSVSVSLNADTSASAGGDFMTIATPARRINLLALQNGLSEQIGNPTLPTGAITAVRLVIDTDSSSITLKDGRVLTSNSTPGIHWQSSAGRPVLSATLNEQIVVRHTGAVVVIDYDLGKAFIDPRELNPLSTDSGFIFSPVVRAVDANRSGAIAGSVKAHTTSGAAVADASVRLFIGDPAQNMNTWSEISTAKSDATGAFRFGYVTQSSFWAHTALAGKPYIVVIDGPAGSGLGMAVVPNLLVTAGGVTTLGSVPVP